ncbi:hypothetical protein HOD75_03260 [archaeon]|jgi:nucleoside 2-deoxyribosyltransferase|nr:hypothetical protein [archaeon]MBT4241892.1 hypothetical protein [archaeon]MBT4418439.1 hypothetical protein [archaeon]
MKAYITCPIRLSQKRWKFLPEIKKIVEQKGINPYVFELDVEPRDIFNTDYSQLKSCDLIIADVSEPSHGVGLEIGIAYCLNIKRILLLEKGKQVTRILQSMPETIIIEYKDLEDLRNKLSSALDNF